MQETATIGCRHPTKDLPVGTFRILEVQFVESSFSFHRFPSLRMWDGASHHRLQAAEASCPTESASAIDDSSLGG